MRADLPCDCFPIAERWPLRACEDQWVPGRGQHRAWKVAGFWQELDYPQEAWEAAPREELAAPRVVAEEVVAAPWVVGAEEEGVAAGAVVEEEVGAEVARRRGLFRRPLSDAFVGAKVDLDG